MPGKKEEFVIDHRGNRTGVLLRISRYEELLAAEEELECIRAFDAAKSAEFYEVACQTRATSHQTQAPVGLAVPGPVPEETLDAENLSSLQ